MASSTSTALILSIPPVTSISPSEVERSLRVLDGAIFVLCAWAACSRSPRPCGARRTNHKVPRIAFVNKMDRAGANFLTVVSQLKERLGANAVALHFPSGAEENFKGLVDLIKMKAIYWDDSTQGMKFEEKEIPAEMVELCKKYRETDDRSGGRGQ